MKNVPGKYAVSILYFLKLYSLIFYDLGKARCCVSIWSVLDQNKRLQKKI